MEKLYEVIQRDKILRANSVDEGIIDHHAERDDKKNTDAKQTRRKKTKTPCEVMEMFPSPYCVMPHFVTISSFILCSNTIIIH